MDAKHHNKHPVRPSGRGWRLGGFAVMGLTALLLLWFIASCIEDLGIVAREQVATGSVLAVTSVKAPSSRLGRPSADMVIVRYRYAVRGRTYETSVVRSTAASTASSVDVYYDRDDPARSSLEDFEAVGRRSRNALILGSIGIAVLTLAVWINSRKAKRGKSRLSAVR
jgi:hypothetical protein